MDDKKTIRDKAIAARRHMGDELVLQYSDSIFKNLYSYIVLSKASKFHVYISYKNEPNTHKLINSLLINNYQVYVPFIKNNTMESAIITNTDFTIGAYGIFEPKNIKIEPKSTLYDVIIVPTLAFDNYKNRLGYGKGFYDRFLATQPKAIKIGLSYEFNKVKQLPTDKFDIKLDKIITEKTIY